VQPWPVAQCGQSVLAGFRSVSTRMGAKEQQAVQVPQLRPSIIVIDT
jgi:hypothetical protein